jgi:amino acid adenylation domain-containing protein
VALEDTLLAAFAVLVVRHGGVRQPAVTVRIGDSVRTAVIHIGLSDDPPFAELLRRVRQQWSVQSAELLAGERFELRFAGGGDGSGLDVALTVSRAADGLYTQIEDPVGADRWPRRWRTLLAAIVADPGVRVGRLAILPPEERSVLLGDWCQTSSSVPAVALVHQMVEAWAERAPDAIALSQASVVLTYAELNIRANRLAHWLRERGVGPDVAVALYGGSTVGMLTGMLAVLKAGGYYIPMDASAPPARTAELLSDCAPRLVLTEGPFATGLPDPSSGARQVCDLADCDLSQFPASAPPVAVHGENLAYVMHTSGSTGRPKGVAMPHRALVRIINWYVTETSIAPGAHVLQFSSFNFDASFCEIFGGWHAGARVVLLPKTEVRRDPELVLELLEAEQIDHMEAPYSGLLNIAHWAVRHSGPLQPRLRTIVTGGEQLLMAPDLVRWLEQLPGCAVRNGYGPSETSVATTYWLRGKPAEWPHLPPIGRPVTDARVYLLDEALQPSPIGVTGEVYVGGDIVARGYAEQPGLTAERFVADPFSPVHGSRMYRTGDLARHRADGELEFLGRSDGQVKIRGHRVEVGEVEARLLEHPNVAEAAVVAHEEATGRSLIGYVVARDAASPPTGHELRRHAERILPEHMVPVRFVPVTAMPRTASGKLDRARLQALPPGEIEVPRTAEQPSDTAAALLGIWRQVLAVPHVGLTDDFFELGGHSLLATRVIAIARAKLGKRVMIGDIFEYPTVELLAARIDGVAAQQTNSEAR